MRILFVAPWIPSRIRPRSLGLLRELTRNHDVWFVGLTAAGEVIDDLCALELAGLTTVPLKRVGAFARTSVALATRASLQVAFVREPALRRAVADVVANFRPDVAHFNVIRSAGVLDAVDNIPVVYDFDEFRSDYYYQAKSLAQSRRERIIARIEAPRMARAEQNASIRSSVVMVSSPLDVRPGTNTVLVRSPHDVHTAAHHAPQAPNILFVGRMGYAPNAHAILWFIDNVLPRVVASVPNVKLTVVGERPSVELLGRASDAVEIVGQVPDVAPYYASASVAIAPITVGTGVQMKLIQSLACAVPTVASSNALTRAGITPGVEAIAADEVDSWAEAVISLLSDDALKSRVASAGRAWAEREYGTSAIARALRAAYTLVPRTDVPAKTTAELAI